MIGINVLAALQRRLVWKEIDRVRHEKRGRVGSLTGRGERVD